MTPMNLDAVSSPCRQTPDTNMAPFSLRLILKSVQQELRISDVTKFQIWMAEGGRGHFLVSWWKK